MESSSPTETKNSDSNMAIIPFRYFDPNDTRPLTKEEFEIDFPKKNYD